MVFRTRKRTLSMEGCELFNIAHSDISPPVQNRFPCMRSFIFNLFTSDFDIKLEKSKDSFRLGTCSLYSFLSDKKKQEIPTFFNNAMTNLVYLILVDEGKINTRQRIRSNINFYYCLAEMAFKNGDHNTVILLKAALENTAIKRLKLKPFKRQKQLTQMFEKAYGTFMNCNAGHLKQILDNNDVDNFLPSLLILLMHLNKTREYAKCYERLGKFPTVLQNKQNQLQNIAEKYYNTYKNYQEEIIDLYLKDPSELKLLEGVTGKTVSTKLYELSLLVDKN